MRGRLIVVGGHTRQIGKTTLVVSLLHTLQPARWIAIKISSHRHGSTLEMTEEFTPSPGTQTGRYLEAGATRAFLYRSPGGHLPAAAARIDSLLASGQNVIVESNRIVAHLRPDLLLFVVAPHVADWKPSSALCLRQATAIVIAGPGELRFSSNPFRSKPDAQRAPRRAVEEQTPRLEFACS